LFRRWWGNSLEGLHLDSNLAQHIKLARSSTREQIYLRGNQMFNYYNGHFNQQLSTQKGDIVKSRGEQVIANLLYSDFNLPYEYENKFTDSATPDFTVYAPDGKVIIWEFIGPGMLEAPGYSSSLCYKYQLYKYLNPLVYRIIFSDNTISSEDVIKKWILQSQDNFFLTSLPQEFLQELEKLSSKDYCFSAKKTNLKHADANSSLSRRAENYWIIDTSSFIGFERTYESYESEGESKWMQVLNFVNTFASLSSVPNNESVSLYLHESWRLNSSNLLPERLDFTNFHPQMRSQKIAFLDPFSSCRYNFKRQEVDEWINILKNRHDLPIRRSDDDSFISLIAKIISSRANCKSQIQLLVDQKCIEYRDIDSPDGCLKNLFQKTVHNVKNKQSRQDNELPKVDVFCELEALKHGNTSTEYGLMDGDFNPRPSRIMGARQPEKKEPDIVDFRIIFEGDPNYVDITPSPDFNFENHSREMSVLRRRYCVETKVWTLRPGFQETNKPLPSKFFGMSEPLTPKSFDAKNSNLFMESRQQNKGKNWAKNRRNRLLKQIKEKVAKYPELNEALSKDISRVFADKDAEKNVEGLEVLRSYYDWRVNCLKQASTKDFEGNLMS